MNTAPAHVAEVVHFELNSGVEPDACLALIGTIGDWAQAEPGFVSRHVSQGEDGTWVDVTVWTAKKMPKQARRRSWNKGLRWK